MESDHTQLAEKKPFFGKFNNRILTLKDSYMEGFISSFHTFKPSLTLLDIDHQNMEFLLNQFSSIHHENAILNSQGFMGVSNENYCYSQHVLPSIDHHFIQNIHPVFQDGSYMNAMMMIPEVTGMGPGVVHGKRKAVDVSASSSVNSSSHTVAECEINESKYQISGKGKKVKASESGEEAKEVVHVRARRGQATDSHSIAERVRRGKINERLRCLQDMVPGCYKSMGMALMLDEIINYVQSLQNQVEFLSMKLTEASTIPTFDSNFTHIDAFQIGNVIEDAKTGGERRHYLSR